MLKDAAFKYFIYEIIDEILKHTIEDFETTNAFTLLRIDKLFSILFSVLWTNIIPLCQLNLVFYWGDRSGREWGESSRKKERKRTQDDRSSLQLVTNGSPLRLYCLSLGLLSGVSSSLCSFTVFKGMNGSWFDLLDKIGQTWITIVIYVFIFCLLKNASVVLLK